METVRYRMAFMNFADKYLRRRTSECRLRRNVSNDQRMMERCLLTIIDLNILRMIKLFAWQNHTIENIEKIRDEELRHQKRSRIMQIALWKANDLMPVLSKSVVIAVYVSTNLFQDLRP